LFTHLKFRRANKYLIGWGNYYRYGNPSKMFQKFNWYVSQRLRKHLLGRSQRPYKLNKEETWNNHFKKLGLINLTKGKSERFRRL